MWLDISVNDSFYNLGKGVLLVAETPTPLLFPLNVLSKYFY